MKQKTSFLFVLSLLLFILISNSVAFCALAHDLKAAARQIQLDTAMVLKNLELSDFYSREKQNSDSAVYYMNKAFRLIEYSDKETISYNMNLKIASYLLQISNYTAASEYYFRALKIIDKETMKQNTDNLSVLKKYETLYRDIAYCLHLYNPKQAIAYLYESLRIAENIYKRDSLFDINSSRVHIYNNLGSMYLDNGRIDSASYFYRKAFGYRNPKDTAMIATLYNNLGIISAEQQDNPVAIRYFMSSLKFRQQSNDSISSESVYLNIGKCYYIEKNYEKALGYYRKALRQSRKSLNLRIELYALEALGVIYRHLGNYSDAYNYLKEYNSLNDSLLSLEKTRASITAMLQYQYEKQKEEFKFKQQMESQRQKHWVWMLMSAALVLLCVVVLLVMLYRHQRSKARLIQLEHESLSLRHENLELRNQRLKEELEHKEKEINIHTEYLLKRNEFVSSVIDKIDRTREGDNGELKKVLKDIRYDIESSVSNESQILFQNLHNDFYEHLYEKHPDLTANEKRLCTFIRLNMASKEISAITKQTVKSIEIARSRLRAKLGLKREDNLTAYLQQF